MTKSLLFNVFTALCFLFSVNAMAQSIKAPVASSTMADGYCDYIQTGTEEAYIIDFSTSGGDTNIANLDSGFGQGGYQDATDQYVSSYAGSTILFDVEMTYLMGFNIWIDWNGDKEFDDSEKMFMSGTYFETVSGSFKIPEDIPNGEYRMRIVGDWLYENPSPCGVSQYGGEAEDYTFVVIDAPSCVAPTDLEASHITANTAVISWDVLEPADQWELVYGLKGFDPETEGTQISVSNQPEVSLDDLESGTLYEVYVKTVCDEGSSDFQFPVLQFYTSCEAVLSLPYIEDFESVTAPEIPECTVVQQLNPGNSWETKALDEYGFSSNVLKYKFTSTPADAWFFTKGIELKADIVYKLDYAYGTNMTGYTEKMKVTLGKYADAMEVTEILHDHTEITDVEAETNSIEFTVSESGVYYIGFNVYSDEFQDRLYLDDISVNEIELSTGSVDFDNFVYYPNPVEQVIQLHASEVIQNVKVYNLLGQEVADFTPNDLQSSLSLEKLAAGNYIMQVQIKGKKKAFQIVKK